jgi:hypothetical protein
MMSLVAIVPVAHRAVLEAVGALMGHSGQEYGVPLSPSGGAPATHYGLRALARIETVAQWNAIKANPALAPVAQGYTGEAVRAAIEALIFDAVDDAPDVGGPHFAAMAQAQGLQQILEGT